jgi:serine protease Do
MNRTLNVGLVSMMSLAAVVLSPAPGLSAPVSSAPRATVKCEDLGASDLRWVTLDEDDTPGDPVESYPSESKLIYAIFDYECIPRKTTIVTVLSYEGSQVSTRKDTLKPTDDSGYWGVWYRYDKEDEYFEDGEWSIEYFNNTELIASGRIMVGEDPKAQVTVLGTVIDSKTKKPIKDARVMILNPDITSKQFIRNNMPDEDIYTEALTTAKGTFVLEQPLKRNYAYGIVVTARGYKPTTYDDVTIEDDAPDPLSWSIPLQK